MKLSHRVEHLLIIGQATVLYGAATFSEDVPLCQTNQETIQAMFAMMRARNLNDFTQVVVIAPP